MGHLTSISLAYELVLVFEFVLRSQPPIPPSPATHRKSYLNFGCCLLGFNALFMRLHRVRVRVRVRIVKLTVQSCTCMFNLRISLDCGQKTCTQLLVLQSITDTDSWPMAVLSK